MIETLEKNVLRLVNPQFYFQCNLIRTQILRHQFITSDPEYCFFTEKNNK